MKNIATAALMMALVVFAAALGGCNGGAIVSVGSIEGPDRIEETASGEYSIDIEGGSGLTFLWSVVPPEVGVFEQPTFSKSQFTAGLVSTDLNAKISVAVSSDQLGSIQKIKNIQIVKRKGFVLTWSFQQFNALAVDNNGNVYVTGTFYGTQDFDPGEGVAELTAKHNIFDVADCFVLKLSPKGDLLWAKAYDNGENEEGVDIAISDDGSIFILSQYEALWPKESRWHYILTKLYPNGERLWDRDVFGYGRRIAIDNMNDIYVTGDFGGTVDFDPGPGIDEHTAVDIGDAFLSKFDTDGVYQWAKTWGGEDSSWIDEGVDVFLDSAGYVYVVGLFPGDSVDFDPGPGMDIHNSTGGNIDIFISKYGANGEFIWAKTWGGKLDYDYCFGGAPGKQDDIHVIGHCQGETDYDPGPGLVKSTAGGSFISNFSDNGDLLWADIFDGYLWQRTILVNNQGDIYTTGIFETPFDFDPGPGITMREMVGNYDMFLTKFLNDGQFQWVQTWGGTDSIFETDAALDPDGYIYILGFFKGSIDFDPASGMEVRTTGEKEHSFLLKLTQNGSWL